MILSEQKTYVMLMGLGHANSAVGGNQSKTQRLSFPHTIPSISMEHNPSWKHLNMFRWKFFPQVKNDHFLVLFTKDCVHWTNIEIHKIQKILYIFHSFYKYTVSKNLFVRQSRQFPNSIYSLCDKYFITSLIEHWGESTQLILILWTKRLYKS